MPDAPSDRTADTSVPVHPAIAARWSPRAFDPTADLGEEDLVGVLEAARWAPTWGRRQPVRFLVGRRADEAFTTLAGLLRRGSGFGWRYWAFLGEDTESGRSKGREPGFYNQLAI